MPYYLKFCSLQIREILFQSDFSYLFGPFLKKRVDYSHGFLSVFFFDTPEVTKIVLQNFKVSLKCTCWPRKLNQKSFSFFPRNIQYRTRLKGPTFEFFRHCGTFFKIVFPQKGPSIVWSFATKWMLKNPKGPPFQIFSALWDFFHQRVPNSPILWRPFAIFETQIWCRLGPFPTCFYKEVN